MSDDQVQEIKNRIDIVDLVNQYVPLKKSGLNHKGLCPFHKERSPSFMVNPERQIFKCFGCSEAGDVLTFVQKMEGLSFPEALELLADRAGIKLDRRKAPEQYAREKDEKSALFRINTAAAKFFHHLLVKHPSGQAARDYLAGRTVSVETMATFQLGWAPPYAQASGGKPPLGVWLKKQGFTDAQLRLAGSPERFQNRVMFPIRDTLGNVVGFTGRLLPEAERSDATHSTPRSDSSLRVGAAAPKYYNTPETPIFRKGQLVYGLYEGKSELRNEHRAVLVEGQMDVILSHQAGVKTAVASSGTAITLDHLKVLRRYVDKLLIAFDADEAGVNAAKKTITLSFDAELVPRVVVLPEGIKDAGEAIEKDPKLWESAIVAAQPAIDWLIDQEIAAQPTPLDGAGKKAVAKAVLGSVGRVQDPVERAHYLGVLASRLHVPEKALVDAFERSRRMQRGSHQPITNHQSPITNQTKRRWTVAEQLAMLLVARPELIAELSLSPELFPTSSLASRLFLGAQTWYNTPGQERIGTAFEAVSRLVRDGERLELNLLAAAVEELTAGQDPRAITQELQVRLTRERNESVKSAIADEIRAAEANGDRVAVKKLMEKLQGALKS